VMSRLPSLLSARREVTRISRASGISRAAVVSRLVP
jgi:hypothetical protein